MIINDDNDNDDGDDDDENEDETNDNDDEGTHTHVVVDNFRRIISQLTGPVSNRLLDVTES